MAASKKNQVNLDALIPRADLYEISEPVIADSPAIRITDLKPGLIYQLLRKPDFQRETANWTPLQVATLIRTFRNSEIIPAIILWQSGGQIFVVDGAHRLSALVAWVRNDYGDGKCRKSSSKAEYQISRGRCTIRPLRWSTPWLGLGPSTRRMCLCLG